MTEPALPITTDSFPLPRSSGALRRSRHIRHGLATKLATAFLALGVSTVGLVTLISYRVAESALRDRMLDQLHTLADADATELTAWVSRQRATLELAARLPDIWMATRRVADGRGGEEALSRALDALAPDVLVAQEVQLLGVPGGRVLASTDPASRGAYAVEQLYYAEGRKATFVQPIYHGPSGRPAFTVATPVVGTDGVTIAVLAAHLDLQQLEGALMRRGGKVPIDASLVNRYAEFVSSERFDQGARARGQHSDGIRSAIAGTSGAGLYEDHTGRKVVGAWRWLPAYELALLLEAPQEAAFAPARTLLLHSLFIGLAATGLLTFGVIGVTRRATRPVLSVAAAAERLARGDFSSEAPVVSDDEVGQLARSFNAMTRRLRALYGELESQVTATRAALHQAQQNRTLLQDVVDHTPALVAVTGLDGRVRLANAQLEAVLGLRPGSATGRSIQAILRGPSTARMLDALERARAAGGAVACELELGHDDDRHLWQAMAFPLKDRGGTIYALAVVATDLTERARAEESRRQQDAKVLQAQKLESLGIMAGGIAHDFNNILGAVLGNVDLALHALDNPAEVRQSLEQIGAATRRASELTRQMLAYAGRASLRREVIDARAVIEDIVGLVRAAQSKRVRFEVTPMPVPLWIAIDPAQLSQVALNLLTNAAEALGDADGTVSLSAAHDAPPGDLRGTDPREPAHGWIRLTVADDGAGMSEEVQRRVFEPFYSTKASGRGLGLSAVNGIIGSIGGVLRVASVVGRGTRFDIYLPAATPPAEPERLNAEALGPPRKATVLVIDDESPLRRVCRRALESAGHDVLEAADGREGLATFRTHRDRVSLVVLDLTMPGMGGAEVLREIRREHADLPVVIASGYDRSDSRAGLPADERMRFLQKPFGTTMLNRVVAELLG